MSLLRVIESQLKGIKKLEDEKEDKAEILTHDNLADMKANDNLLEN